jgi:hypothetical protein
VVDTVLDIIIRVCTLLGDLAFTALAIFSPGVGLVILSALTGLLMLLVWRYTSNQAAIADVRRKISAYLLATRLFKDNLAVTFRAQRQILRQCLRLLGLAVRPTLIMLVPFVLVMTQIGLRYEFRPAPIGRTVRVTATLRPGHSPITVGDVMQLPDGLSRDPQDPCRAAALRTIDWRLTPTRADHFTLILRRGSDAIEVPLIVGDGLTRLSRLRGGGWFDRLLYSAEPSIPQSSSFESVLIHYPSRSTPIFGLNFHWLLMLLALSIVFALILRPILKVHI